MPRKGLTKHMLLAVAVLVLATTSSLAADAEEAGRIKSAKSVLEALKKAQKTRDVKVASTQLRELVLVHNVLKTTAWRSKLQERACEMIRDPGWVQVRSQAVRSLAEINDKKAAWKHLRKSMPGRREKEVDAVGLAVLGAVGKHAPDGAIAPLIVLMRKAKAIEASKGAIQALGGYRGSKRRVLVLEEVLDHLKKTRPSRAPGKRIGEETRRRWNAVRGPLVATLNRLTGRTESSVQTWLDLFKQHKKNLKELFEK